MQSYIWELILLWGFLLLAIFFFSLLLTILNFIRLFQKSDAYTKKHKMNILFDIFIIAWGIGFSLLQWGATPFLIMIFSGAIIYLSLRLFREFISKTMQAILFACVSVGCAVLCLYVLPLLFFIWHDPYTDGLLFVYLYQILFPINFLFLTIILAKEMRAGKGGNLCTSSSFNRK